MVFKCLVRIARAGLADGSSSARQQTQTLFGGTKSLFDVAEPVAALRFPYAVTAIHIIDDKGCKGRLYCPISGGIMVGDSRGSLSILSSDMAVVKSFEPPVECGKTQINLISSLYHNDRFCDMDLTIAVDFHRCGIWFVQVVTRIPETVTRNPELVEMENENFLLKSTSWRMVSGYELPPIDLQISVGRNGSTIPTLSFLSLFATGTVWFHTVHDICRTNEAKVLFRQLAVHDVIAMRISNIKFEFIDSSGRIVVFKQGRNVSMSCFGEERLAAASFSLQQSEDLISALTMQGQWIHLQYTLNKCKQNRYIDGTNASKRIRCTAGETAVPRHGVDMKFVGEGLSLVMHGADRSHLSLLNHSNDHVDTLWRRVDPYLFYDNVSSLSKRWCRWNHLCIVSRIIHRILGSNRILSDMKILQTVGTVKHAVITVRAPPNVVALYRMTWASQASRGTMGAHLFALLLGLLKSVALIGAAAMGILWSRSHGNAQARAVPKPKGFLSQMDLPNVSERGRKKLRENVPLHDRIIPRVSHDTEEFIPRQASFDMAPGFHASEEKSRFSDSNNSDPRAMIMDFAQIF